MNGKEIQFVGSSTIPAHTHSASDITSGILPVTRGGTGVSSLSALKSQLGIETIYTISVTLDTERNQEISQYSTGYNCKRIVVSGSTKQNITIGRSTYSDGLTHLNGNPPWIDVYNDGSNIMMVLSSTGRTIYYKDEYGHGFGGDTFTIMMYV